MYRFNFGTFYQKGRQLAYASCGRCTLKLRRASNFGEEIVWMVSDGANGGFLLGVFFKLRRLHGVTMLRHRK